MLAIKVVEPNTVDPVMKLSAEVKCPKCNKKYHANMTSKKLVGGVHGKLQWSISNFQLHFRTHFKRPKNGLQTSSVLASLVSNCGRVENGVSGDTSDDNIQTITVAENEIDEEDETVISSRKRKFNMITDDECEKENDVPTKSSGECLLGVLARQNTPKGYHMP